jgi:ribosomal protein L44E
MSAPITKLSDRFADYTLRIRCKKCNHERVTDPQALAKLLGWETPLAKVAMRLRCSKCNVRGECELTAMNTPKPRGYRDAR